MEFKNMTSRIAALPRDSRGFPIPWFVAYVDGEPCFPVADARKIAFGWVRRKCWVCGGDLGRINAFVIGPMCAVNRTSSEPPSHLDCARFSAINCPFLTKPRMKRVGVENIPMEAVAPAGKMIERNPGVTLVWQTLRPSIFNDGRGGVLFDIGKPHKVEWFSHGRPATRHEVVASVDSGLPALEALCEAASDPSGVRIELQRRILDAIKLYPAV